MAEETFTALVRGQGKVSVLEMSGVLTASAAEILQRAFGEVEQLGSGPIALGFTQVSYINSAGIAQIVSLLARARQNKRKLVAWGLSEHYREIFEITRLTDYITLYPDEASLVRDQA
jgi:anti-anti-sigma factor